MLIQYLNIEIQLMKKFKERKRSHAVMSPYSSRNQRFMEMKDGLLFSLSLPATAGVRTVAYSPFPYF